MARHKTEAPLVSPAPVCSGSAARNSLHRAPKRSQSTGPPPKRGKLATSRTDCNNAETTCQDMYDTADTLGCNCPNTKVSRKSTGMEGNSGQVVDDDSMAPRSSDVQIDSQISAAKHFPLMDLPTEIRLEVYRACLTRPWNVLLSKPSTRMDLWAERGSRDVDMVLHHEGTGDINGPEVHLDSSTGANAVTVTTQSSHDSTFSNIAPPSHTISSAPPLPQFSVSPLAFPGLHREYQPDSMPKLQTDRTRREDPLHVNLLCASKQIYKEARGVLYSENLFSLSLETAQATLSSLHQRSRRQIKHVELEIPNYNEILERFQETVRLSLRYCTGLKRFVIHLPFMLSGADGFPVGSNRTVYANGFDILRWLPQDCDILLSGNTCAEVDKVVQKHLHLARTLDKFAYARRQHISNDSGPITPASP